MTTDTIVWRDLGRVLDGFAVNIRPVELCVGIAFRQRDNDSTRPAPKIENLLAGKRT
ncbi:MAG TPA: hypothetical protein VFX06_16000 [Stellaceae bacterium]|nr:hypothetical protein [Stellaceae bacterium]